MNKPYQGRAIIQDSPNELHIEISGSRNWFIIAFISAWLVGWVLGELFALGMLTGLIEQELQAGLDNYFIAFWLLVWTGGGVYVIRAWLYMTFGSETLTLSQEKLKIDKKFALFYKPKVYRLSQVRNFSVNPTYRKDPLAIRKIQTWNLNAEGAIKFDYGPQTVFFGSDIDKSEANHLINLMKEKPVW